MDPRKHVPALEHSLGTVGLALLVLIASCSGSRELMPTPLIHSEAAADPFASVPKGLRTDTVDVLYVTDREPERDDEDRLEYGHGRSESLAFGSVVVGIGDSPGWEALARESRTDDRELDLEMEVRSVVELGRFPKTPLLGDRAEEFEEAAARRLRREIRRRLDQTPKKEAYVFIHGTATGFEESVFIMAELWHFLGRQGIPISYSWPAGKGRMLHGYPRDRESGEFTIFHLKQFLRILGTCPGVEKVHILAHSRGADVASTAIRELMIEARGAGKDLKTDLKLMNLVLAAPDLDYDVANQRIGAELLSESIGALTIYASGDDQAIGLADWLFDSEVRVGGMTSRELSARQKALLEKLEGLQVVEFTGGGSVIGHDYFRLNPLASSDLILLLRDGRSPGASHGRPLEFVAPGYWLLTDEYLSE